MCVCSVVRVGQDKFAVLRHHLENRHTSEVHLLNHSGDMGGSKARHTTGQAVAVELWLQRLTACSRHPGGGGLCGFLKDPKRVEKRSWMDPLQGVGGPGVNPTGCLAGPSWYPPKKTYF